MSFLLDVNLLIALTDSAHVDHDAAHSFFKNEGCASWITTPFTESGFVRVLSNPAYPSCQLTVSEAIDHLRMFCAHEGHRFIPDSLPIAENVAQRHLQGHRQITDAYLLALAVKNDCVLVTFDKRINLKLAHKAKPRHLRHL